MSVLNQVDDFIRWQSNRFARKTGRQPAATTLRVKRARLSGVVRHAQVEDLSVLGTRIQDRASAECLLDQLGLHMSNGSLRQVVDVLREFGEYAVAKGWATGCALTKDDMPPSNPQKPIVVYTEDEIALIVGAARAKGLRWWAFLATLTETGRRVGEVLALRWDWLHTEAEIPHFELPHTKNGRQNYVPLSALLRDEVFTELNCKELANAQQRANNRFHRPVEEFVFPWSHQTVTKMFQLYCENLGIRSRGFHCFRHTRATELISKGVPIQAVSALLGHSDISTTSRIYNHATALSFAQYLE